MTTQEAIEPPARLVLKVDEAAAMLRVSKSALYGMLATGELDSIRIGKSRRIPMAVLNEYVAAKLGADVTALVLHGSPPRALPVDIEAVADRIAARVAERLVSAAAALAEPRPRY
jgi:excisionase family DNA binding protein